MDKKRRNKLLIAVACMALVIGVFALITVAVTSTTMAEAETEADIEEGTASGAKNDSSSGSSEEKKAAEKLIDKTMSREKVKKNVGEWEKFEMSSDGCERGVYAGKFYYKDFTIFSRTYDKGKTFHIVSVN